MKKDIMKPNVSVTRLGVVKTKLDDLFEELFEHNGYGQINIDMKILKKGQKEIILKSGKEFRFVVDM